MAVMKITPIDNLFFRNGMTFDYKTTNWLKSDNMPNPSVFYGSIFTTMLAQNEEFRKTFMGNNNSELDDYLLIKSIYLYNSDKTELYMKAPKDIFKKKTGRLIIGKFKRNKISTSISVFPLILENPKNAEIEKNNNQWIRMYDFTHIYSNNNVYGINLCNEEDLFSKSYKTGIKIDYKNKNVEDSMLFNQEFTRFTHKNWHYLIEFEIKNHDINIEEKGFLKLGGESKAAKYELIDKDTISGFTWLNEFNTYYKNKNSSYFKVVFTTPTYLNFEETKNKIFSIIGLANDKPKYIGGFDVKKLKPKTMKRMLPAGSTAIIEAKESIGIEEIKKELNEYFNYENYRGFNKFLIIPLEEDIWGGFFR